jgi:hypothetical protein
MGVVYNFLTLVAQNLFAIKSLHKTPYPQIISSLVMAVLLLNFMKGKERTFPDLLLHALGLFAIFVLFSQYHQLWYYLPVFYFFLLFSNDLERLLVGTIYFTLFVGIGVALKSNVAASWLALYLPFFYFLAMYWRWATFQTDRKTPT